MNETQTLTMAATLLAGLFGNGTSTVVGALGGTSALPTTPIGYIIINV